MPTLKRLIYWGLRSNERGLREQVSRMHSSIKIRSMRPAANLELSLRGSKPLNPVNCSPAALFWRGRSKFGGGEGQRNTFSPVVLAFPVDSKTLQTGLILTVGASELDSAIIRF